MNYNQSLLLAFNKELSSTSSDFNKMSLLKRIEKTLELEEIKEQKYDFGSYIWSTDEDRLKHKLSQLKTNYPHYPNIIVDEVATVSKEESEDIKFSHIRSAHSLIRVEIDGKWYLILKELQIECNGMSIETKEDLWISSINNFMKECTELILTNGKEWDGEIILDNIQYEINTVFYSK